jgi:hypothetical protein
MKEFPLQSNPMKFSPSQLMILLTLSFGVTGQAMAQAAVDPSYHGSSFNQVLDVLENQGFVAQTEAEKEEFDAYQGGRLPQYRVDYFSMCGLIFSPLANRSKATLVERADYYDYFKKFVHANGVCVVGKWDIQNQTPFYGYFKTGAKGLVVGRISVALETTTREGKRGFGFAGKIFPTMDVNAVVPTTNFFTVDDLSGTSAERFLDVAVTNEPPLIPRFDLIGVLAKIIPAFIKADSSPTFRPVTQIARTGAGSEVTSPIWMRLRPSAGTIKNNQSDFRSEVIQAMQENRGLTFVIDTSNTTKDRNATQGWTPIGTIQVDRAIESYGCDRRLHFSHPKDDKSNVTPKKEAKS